MLGSKTKRRLTVLEQGSAEREARLGAIEGWRGELGDRVAALERASAQMERPDPAKRPLLEPMAAVAQLPTSAEKLLGVLSWLGDTHQARGLRELSAQELDARMRADGWPIPATDDREGYWGQDHDMYWLSGLADHLFLAGFLPTDREESVLVDLGSASGRVLRHFALAPARGRRLIGADMNRRMIAWMRRHLGGLPIECQQTRNAPPLSLEDGSVDFLYALSVFTHVDEFEEAWLAEIRRVLRPGGRAFLTYHSERSWAMLADPDQWLTRTLQDDGYVVEDSGVAANVALFERPMPQARVVLNASHRDYQYLNIFHAREDLLQRWGRILTVEETFERAHGELQDAVLVTKSARGG